jgi:hypothetical protein
LRFFRCFDELKESVPPSFDWAEWRVNMITFDWLREAGLEIKAWQFLEHSVIFNSLTLFTRL